MTGMEITLRDVYDAQQATTAAVSALSGRMDQFSGRVDARLDSGDGKFADHETRLREAEAAIPPRLDERLSELERFRWKAAGMGLLAGGLTSIAAAFVDYALTHH